MLDSLNRTLPLHKYNSFQIVLSDLAVAAEITHPFVSCVEAEKCEQMPRFFELAAKTGKSLTTLNGGAK